MTSQAHHILLVGERLNSTHPSVKRILGERDEEAFRAIVDAQLKGGASCIDLNASMLMGTEEDALRWGAGIVRGAFGALVMIDSADRGILARLGAEYGGDCVLNSVSADEEALEEILPAAARAGAGVVVMLKDIKGIPQSVEEKLALAARVSASAAQAGIAPEKLFIDPVFSPIATDSGGMIAALECIRGIRERFPLHRTIGGLSNVSFGLPERKLINRSFAAMASAFGISALICDTTDRELMKVLQASETLSGRDRSCKEFLKRYRREREASASVLVVDDEQAIRDMLKQFLSERGYRVTTAASAQDALALIARERYDVALIDLKLPDRAGLDLLEPLVRANPESKCIIMTAFASLESTIEALRLNAFDYITKPFDLLKIGEVVDAAVAQIRARESNDEVVEELSRANRTLEDSARALEKQLLVINGELSEKNESLKRHVTRLRVLYQMGRDISSNENWSDALDRFLMALCKYLEADGAGLLLFSNNEHVLKIRTAYQLENLFLDDALRRLSEAQESDELPSETFNLDKQGTGRFETCLAMTARWEHTAVPLLYKGRWLGFLLIRKAYRSRRSYLGDYHFINTIQTILTEEVANAVNISRLRNLKDFNETILENINSGVLTTDHTGTVTYVNGRARELIGERVETAVKFDDLFANPFGSGGLFEYLVSRAEERLSLECALYRKGGDPITVRLNARTVRLDDHHGNAAVVIFEDLSAQKEMEEELRRADRLRSLGELSAGVAHEIRNPLTGIATTAQVLHEKLGDDAERRRYVKVILDEIARLDDIIKNLLNFARPVLPRPKDISLPRLIEETLILVSDKAAERGVELRFENRLRDERCMLDADQVKQIMLNVALNGIEACEAGGVVMVLVREGTNPALVEIEFADSGCGIPEDIADKLYNPFFTTKPEGTGMGLSISRKIAEGHGGRIYHRSTRGKGTSFIIELPRKTLAVLKRPAAGITERGMRNG